jgi:2-polyprenyl-6-methoxyphenol hydroxylase-like FAD-dependent oxidoreductase
VNCLVVERHAGTAIHPRAAHFNQRTIEVYRSVGLEDAIVEAAAKEFVQDGAIVSVESLAGKELEWFFRNINEGVEDLSPCRQLFITQKGLEPILLAHARGLGARVEYSCACEALEQDGEGVTATLAGGRQVRAHYVVAADGSRSPARERLGIDLRGRGVFSKSVTIYFRADASPLFNGRNLSVIYIFNPQVYGFLRFEFDGQSGFLAASKALDSDGELTSDLSGLTEEQCAELVRISLGVPDLPVEIENVQPWNASADSAERYQESRVFLAGDSAHQMPPNGGFGGNTGIADAHNLAWKLAHVLRGDADPSLLDTYDAERGPVGAFTAEQAYTRYVVRLAPELKSDDLTPFVPDPPIALGHRYRSSAILDDGADELGGFVNPRELSGEPGFRAPHVDLGGGRSTVDLFGPGFAVLSRSEAWCDTSAVEAHRVDAPVADRYGIGEEGAVLVRPDGFVAWRAPGAVPEPGSVLRGALRHVLGR